MKLLLVEDEDETISKLESAARATGIEFFSGKNDLQAVFGGDDPLEQQLTARFAELREKFAFEIVLLDTNLSRMKNGLSASACRQSLQELGIPVCRYSKRQSSGQQMRFQELQRLAIEGASAIGVSGRLLDSPEDELMPWLLHVQSGFAMLEGYLAANTDGHVRKLGPAGTLASLIGRPSATSDFLGYTSQSLQFFGPTFEAAHDKPDSRSIGVAATRLGYWLFNSILMFPGPILQMKAAAAFLNIRVDALNNSAAALKLIQPASYVGPFSEVDDYYWREDLENILEKFGGDLLRADELKAENLPRVDEKNAAASAYLCVISETQVQASEVGPNPDWIPAGAQLARIRRDIFEKLDPMLSA